MPTELVSFRLVLLVVEWQYPYPVWVSFWGWGQDNMLPMMRLCRCSVPFCTDTQHKKSSKNCIWLVGLLLGFYLLPFYCLISNVAVLANGN